MAAGTTHAGEAPGRAPSGPNRCRNMAPHTAARQYIEPTDRSIPPEMMTNVAPTAMMAKNEVFLASLSRLSARKNLLTVRASPVCRSRTCSEPPKMDNSRARTTTTPSSPVSFNRGKRLIADQRPNRASMNILYGSAAALSMGTANTIAPVSCFS